MLKATARIASGLMAVVLCFSASRAVRRARQWRTDYPGQCRGLTQSDAAASQPDDKRQQAANLLRRARQAMRESDLTTADLLIKGNETEPLKNT